MSTGPLPFCPAKRLACLAALILSLGPVIAAGSPTIKPRAEPPRSPTRTIVHDARAKRLLLGRHLLGLQWIGSDDLFGEAVVTESDGVLRIRGEQRGRGEGVEDYLTIEGVIMSVAARTFVMDGTVTTRIHHIKNGEPCHRRGRLEFKISGQRHYWRMQDMANPCDEATDYVDVFLREGEWAPGQRRSGRR